jgi:hypothetical protein
MRYFSIKNFEKHQHWKNGRNNPWVRFYVDLLGDYEFMELSDNTKLSFCLLMLIASKTDNKIPCDPGWLKKRMNTTFSPNLDKLQAAGFIEVLEHDNKLLSQSRVDESRVDKNNTAKALQTIWNENCLGLPKCQKLTDKRILTIKKRLKEEPDLAVWKNCAIYLSGSKWHIDMNANFDFFINSNTITRYKEKALAGMNQKKISLKHVLPPLAERLSKSGGKK